MMGWNLPPGCEVSDLPGNRPEDEDWDHYWDEEIDRIIEVFKTVFGRDPTKEEHKNTANFYDIYDKDMDFKKAIDKDFDDWRYNPPDDERI